MPASNNGSTIKVKAGRREWHTGNLSIGFWELKGGEGVREGQESKAIRQLCFPERNYIRNVVETISTEWNFILGSCSRKNGLPNMSTSSSLEPVMMSPYFANVTKLKILRWGDYPGLPLWTQYNYKGPYNQRQKKESKRCENVILLALKMEEETKS